MLVRWKSSESLTNFGKLFSCYRVQRYISDIFSVKPMVCIHWLRPVPTVEWQQVMEHWMPVIVNNSGMKDLCPLWKWYFIPVKSARTKLEKSLIVYKCYSDCCTLCFRNSRQTCIWVNLNIYKGFFNTRKQIYVY